MVEKKVKQKSDFDKFAEHLWNKYKEIKNKNELKEVLKNGKKKSNTTK